MTEPVDAPNLSEFRLVDMHTSVVEKSERCYFRFVYTGITPRIVVAIVAFSMRIDCVKVQQVVKWLMLVQPDLSL